MKTIFDTLVMEIKEILKNLVKTDRNNRANFIVDYIKSINEKVNIFSYKNGKNIEFIKYGQNRDKDIIFFSHYDISKETMDGANDNSSSVAVLLKLIEYLNHVNPYYNIRLIFNDKEEILGALLNKNLDLTDLSKIITNVGSFQYLKSFTNKNNILAIFNLELSGIGDVLYFATKSGLVNCNENLINFLEFVSKKENIKYLKLPILNSDMISIHTLSLKGVVYGAIPEYEGKNYSM
ncbi:MAG TPA: M28 family peptidase, partial [Spirochaetota bacterium]|nr:M28 family peptidase [Spirochaetota bacterium]